MQRVSTDDAKHVMPNTCCRCDARDLVSNAPVHIQLGFSVDRRHRVILQYVQKMLHLILAILFWFKLQTNYDNHNLNAPQISPRYNE
jgi:hypothetical protein